MDHLQAGEPRKPVALERKTWEEPRIVFERLLEASAQGGPPATPGAPSGFLGPLNTSGGSGTCG